MNQQITLSILRNFGGFLVAAIPIMQFGFKWLPEQIRGLFISGEMLLLTMVMTFLFSVFAIYFAFMENGITLPFKGFVLISSYAGYLPMITFISMLSFVSIGAAVSPSEAWWGWIIFQVALYILTISSSVLFLAIKIKKVSELKYKENAKKQRPRDAINLAVEHDGFAEIPRITFQKAYEEKSEGYTPNFYCVEVGLGDESYKITTDSNVQELYSVTRINS